MAKSAFTDGILATISYHEGAYRAVEAVNGIIKNVSGVCPNGRYNLPLAAHPTSVYVPVVILQ